MSTQTALFFMSLALAALFCVILYQRYAFGKGTQKKLLEIGRQLKEITDVGNDKKVLVFTENTELQELAAQINRFLEMHWKVKADYCRSQSSSRKMLSNISHDIKTPMTVILGYLEIMRINGDKSDEMLQKTERKAAEVLELINRFFTLAKIESGDMALEISTIDLCEVCRKTILDFYEILSNNHFEVEIDIPDAPVYVQGNTEALQRILSNLISNAIRYGADGNYLGLSLKNNEKEAAIAVTDRGKGIDKLFAEHVFERLFTMEDSRSRKIQGNGLGLAIAQNLAQQLNGTITLDSIPDEKTTFTVRFFSCERNL